MSVFCYLDWFHSAKQAIESDGGRSEWDINPIVLDRTGAYEWRDPRLLDLLCVPEWDTVQAVLENRRGHRHKDFLQPNEPAWVFPRRFVCLGCDLL